MYSWYQGVVQYLKGAVIVRLRDIIPPSPTLIIWCDDHVHVRDARPSTKCLLFLCHYCTGAGAYALYVTVRVDYCTKNFPHRVFLEGFCHICVYATQAVSSVYGTLCVFLCACTVSRDLPWQRKHIRYLFGPFGSRIHTVAVQTVVN